MGACGSSGGGGDAPSLPPTAGMNTGGGAGGGPTLASETYQSTGIDRVLDKAKQEEESKVKLLLLGAGESGKSTIFKQMRIIYGTPPSDEELKYFGVIVRSNMVVAIRKLSLLLEKLGYEDRLQMEEAGPDGLSPWDAYLDVKGYLIEGRDGMPESAPAQDAGAANGSNGIKDWVGHCQRAGLTANDDAKKFMVHTTAINTLWQVRICLLRPARYY
jgi:hypothetical protein